MCIFVLLITNILYPLGWYGWLNGFTLVWVFELFSSFCPSFTLVKFLNCKLGQKELNNSQFIRRLKTLIFKGALC